MNPHRVLKLAVLPVFMLAAKCRLFWKAVGQILAMRFQRFRSSFRMEAMLGAIPIEMEPTEYAGIFIYKANLESLDNLQLLDVMYKAV